MTTDKKLVNIETGIYVRVERDGEWSAHDIVELTDKELNDFIATKEPNAGWQWFRTVLGILKGKA